MPRFRARPAAFPGTRGQPGAIQHRAKGELALAIIGLVFRLVAQHHYASRHFSRCMVHLDGEPLTDGPGFRSQDTQARIDP